MDGPKIFQFYLHFSLAFSKTNPNNGLIDRHSIAPFCTPKMTIMDYCCFKGYSSLNKNIDRIPMVLFFASLNTDMAMRIIMDLASNRIENM